MTFDNLPPKWDAEGTEPTTELQEKGFVAGYKPPAAYFNYLFNKIIKCLKELQTKLSGVSNAASDLEKTRRIKTYVSFSEIGQTIGSETIEGIAEGMPSNSELLVSVGADSARIYPQIYGLLHVFKKDSTRTVFRFYNKSIAYEYIGIYDSSTTSKWSGWHYSLREEDVVDNLTSTGTKVPLSAKQGKVLNDNHENHTANKENPHAVTKSQVGLGNVPNVSTNNQTPTYTVASSLTALTSGEVLSTAFGKIAKAVSTLISHVANKENPHSVTKEQVGLGNVPNVTTNNQTPTYTAATTLATLASGETLNTAFGKIAKAVSELINHLKNTSNPHAVTKSQVGLGNVPNVATNDQTPTYSDTTTLATLKSGEKLNVAFQKIKCAITNLIDHIASHKVKMYVSLPDIELENGSETIESIATSLPDNSELLIQVGADNNVDIYPTTYGILRVTKKNSSRISFEFYTKSGTRKWIGNYDSSTTTKWFGWATVLVAGDVVDNLTTSTNNMPLSAKQGKTLNEKKVNGGTIDFSSYTLANIVDYINSQAGKAFVGRFRLAADHSPTGTNTWFRGMLACQNAADSGNDVSVNIIALTGDNVEYIGNIYGITSFSLRWSKLLRTGDVVDNLLSTKADLPLSANQGRVLKEAQDKINSDIAPKKEWVIGLNKNGKKIYQTEVYRGLGADASGFAESTDYRVIAIGHEIPNVEQVLACDIVFEKGETSYRLPYMVNGVAHTYLFTADRSNLRFYNKAAFPNYYFHAIITYTKTTD